MRETNIVWNASDGNVEKTSTWYWTIGIIAVGVAVAGFILGNILFSMLAILGGFVIMLAGSQPERNQRFAVTEKGLHMDKSVVPFQNITRFSIHEDAPQSLTIEAKGLIGVITIPLTEGADYRSIRSQLKNHGVDEEDEISSFSEGMARRLGL